MTVRRMATAAVGLVVVVVTSCGLATEDAASPVEAPEFWEDGTTSTTGSTNENDLFSLTLYWIDSADVNPLLLRTVRFRDVAPVIEDGLAALVEGPSEETREAYPNVRTFFTAQLNPTVEAAPTDGLLVIRVADEAGFREEPRAELFQQLVCTLTEPSLTNGAVDRVRVVDSQGDIPLTNYNLEPLEGGGTRADYGDCVQSAGEPADPTTSSTTDG